MSTLASAARSTHTMQYYREKEKAAFSAIPGMNELLHADDSQRSELAGKYPDAVFALTMADNLLCGDREQNEINQQAYIAILNGEKMANIRFRYDKETEAYVKCHMWDD